MVTMTSFLPSLPDHVKTYISDLQFCVPLETHHPEDDIHFNNENCTNTHIVHSALHYSKYQSFHNEMGSYLHLLMGKVEDLLIEEWNSMTAHHKKLIDEVKVLYMHQKNLVTANNTTVKFSKDLAACSAIQKEELSDLWEKVGTLNKALDLLQGNSAQGKHACSRSLDTRNVCAWTRDSHDDEVTEIGHPMPYVSC
ncbi:hypothetical protein F5146DRAFT_1006573 [Armillaria mellea]|nr:hypothetical protein F5146DRAFT_1006573 [Armillaria mellea]